VSLKDKFVPTSFKPKTVASVTAAFQKAINDLLQIEQQSNAKHDLIEKQMLQYQNDHAVLINAMGNDQDAALAEAEKAAKVRVKLEALLS